MNTVIVGWTGMGDIGDLRSSIAGSLKAEGISARARQVGSTIRVDGAEPVRVAGVLENLPGVSWVAVGHAADSYRAMTVGASGIAKSYVGKRGAFAVRADAFGEKGAASDMAGAVTSAILGTVKGSRVREDSPPVVFRVAHDGRRGAVGVQLGAGPGGAPTRAEGACILVSGGRHSSVVAWMTLLAGYSAELVHAAVDESSLRSVALLYAELSHRVDPAALSLTLLEGAGVGRCVREWLKVARTPVMAGLHSEGGAVARDVPAHFVAPLFVLNEEEFSSIFSGLSVKEDPRRERWSRRSGGRVTVRRLGGVRTDVSGVLDGLGRPGPLSPV